MLSPGNVEFGHDQAARTRYSSGAGAPADRQDVAGELLLALAAGEAQYRLTPAQLEDLKLALEEADQGNFASEADMAETWKKFGL
jgi:hypothetical protein